MLFLIFQESLLKSLNTMLLLALILLPILISLEYIRHYNLLQRISARFKWLTRLLALPPEAALPLVVGLFVGLFYGAAVIMEYAKEGLLKKRDLMLIGIFLAINHSFLEDNLLLTALGANFPVLLLARFVAAFLVTRLAAAWLDRKRDRERKQLWVEKTGDK